MSQKDRFVQVILPLAVEGTFTYRVPGTLINQVDAGSRVLVPFGKKRMYAAVVRSLSSAPPEGITPKNLSRVLDEAPLVNAYQLQFWDWMSSYYMCTPGEVLRAALPSGLRPESESRIRVNPSFNQGVELEPPERLLYEVVKDQGELTLHELEMACMTKNPMSVLKKLIEKGAVEINEFVRRSPVRKVNKYIRIAGEYASEKNLNKVFEQLTRAQRQTAVLDRYLQLAGPEPFQMESLVLKSELAKIKGGATALATLLKKGILEEVEREESGPGGKERKVSTRELHVLNEEQRRAMDQIRIQFMDHQAVLLHGVTSCGKTEIYSHLIRETLDKGQQVLYLLPEIALTAQIIERMKAIFGERVGVYHSRYSDSDRVHVYRNLLGWTDEEQYQLIIGVRSAVFLPFSALGLIVVDEEHETTYKQHDPAPRYHARDSAQILALYHGARVLLGTATPSFETLFNARNNKYGYTRILQRFGNVREPELILADIRTALKRKQMVSHFSPQLMEGIKAALGQGEQVILFQNRRGYSNYLVCDTCGHVPKCSRCDVSLTYHMQSGKMECHYCGQKEPVPGNCPSCHATNLRMKGFGTEKIEEEIALLFEGIRVGRLDMDTARTTRGYERVISDFELGKTDLLIGTQMLSKGLDFENVGLVGILDADSMMNFPDFRSFERSFQLISQVSGRAGRREKQGRVIIQTGVPDHPVIQYVLNNDYEGLYREQMEERELFGYPPFRRMIRISFRHRIPAILDAATEMTGRELREVFASRVFGPQYPPVKKVQNYFIKQIMLKIERKASFERARKLLQDVLEETGSNEVYRAIRISIDVDPY